MKSGIILNGEEMTWDEYHKREEELRKKAYEEYEKEWNKSHRAVKDLRKGDKIIFDYGDYGIEVIMQVESVNGLDVIGKVLSSMCIHYKVGELATVHCRYDDEEFDLVND